MSETTKPAEAARKAQDIMAGGADSATSAVKDAAGQTARLADVTAERARQAAGKAAETISAATNAATGAADTAARSGQDVLMLGMRTAVGKAADISFDRGHHLLSSTVQAMDIYSDAAERSSQRVQALVTSALVFTRGVQKMQQAWLEMIDQSMERAAHRPQDLLRCKTLVELAEVQRDIYAETVNHAFDSTARLLDLASRTAQDAVRPLQAH